VTNCHGYIVYHSHVDIDVPSRIRVFRRDCRCIMARLSVPRTILAVKTQNSEAIVVPGWIQDMGNSELAPTQSTYCCPHNIFPRLLCYMSQLKFLDVHSYFLHARESIWTSTRAVTNWLTHHKVPLSVAMEHASIVICHIAIYVRLCSRIYRTPTRHPNVASVPPLSWLPAELIGHTPALGRHPHPFTAMEP
jgi:hypothetical protein